MNERMLSVVLFLAAKCARDVGVQEQEQSGEQRQPPGRLQGLHLRAGGGGGAGAVAGAGHPRQAVGELLVPDSISSVPFSSHNNTIGSPLVLRVTNACWMDPWQVSPADAYRLCRYDWMREALSALLDRLTEEPEPPKSPAAEGLGDHAGVCMMVKATTAAADRAVALC
jgi:hypothetical protein